MGSSKRYAHHYDRLMDNRTLERIAAEGPLQTLTPKELRADSLPVTRDPLPKACKAWVRFGPRAVQVEAMVVVWNDLACGIQFQVGENELRCWVWSNAVTPLE
ncbi:hypothetical protein [Microbacterium sp. P5_E9]